MKKIIFTLWLLTHSTLFADTDEKLCKAPLDITYEIRPEIIDAPYLDNHVTHVRNNFLIKFANHLDETRNTLNPDFMMDFNSTQCMDTFYQQMIYGFEYGFEIELDVANLLEYIHVFNLDLTESQVQSTLRNPTKTAKEKLKALSKHIDRKNRFGANTCINRLW